MSRRKVFWICSKCKSEFRRITRYQRICDACKEETIIKCQEKYIKTNPWQILRNRIIKRDGGCKICGTDKNIHIHHWDKNRNNNNLNNLVTLCHIHHAKIHTLYSKR